MHTTEYYSASKKKEVLTYVVAWKGIGDLSKMNQSKDTYQWSVSEAGSRVLVARS